MLDTLNKLQERAQKATERYATKLASAVEMERKRDMRRKVKLGTAALQMFEAGDMTLLDRFEQSITCCFDRKIDRLDFGLDEEDNWFDGMREAARLVASAMSAPDYEPTAKPRPAVAAVPAPRPSAQAGGTGVSAGGASGNGTATTVSANA